MGPVRLVAATVAAASLAFAAAGCSPTGGTQSGETTRATATVEWVSDGDTLRLTDGRKVRLLQIDAPEREADCYGRDATRALIALTPKGTRVVLEADPSLDGTDKYGRLLRYVIVDGDNVNLALVEQGAAAAYFFHNERGRYAKVLLSAAKRARSDGLGFWGACPAAELNPGLGSVTGSASQQRK